MSDIYLEDLRDKTLRGMEGQRASGHRHRRPHARLSDGPIIGARWAHAGGFEIEIEPEGAALVRRIFAMYIWGGSSFTGIAMALNNAEGVPSPRDPDATGARTVGSPSTIRAILYNERYTGVIIFNERRGSRCRAPTRRVPQNAATRSDVVRQDLRHRTRHCRCRHVGSDQGQADSTAALTRSTTTARRRARARGVRQRATPSPACCSAARAASPMIIGGGGPAQRNTTSAPPAAAGAARCAGPCARSVARAAHPRSAARQRAVGPQDAERIRKRLAEPHRRASAEPAAQRRTSGGPARADQKRIANLVEAMADGRAIRRAVSRRCSEAETQADAERTDIGQLERLGAPANPPPEPERSSWKGSRTSRRCVEGELRSAPGRSCDAPLQRTRGST